MYAANDARRAFDDDSRGCPVKRLRAMALTVAVMWARELAAAA